MQKFYRLSDKYILRGWEKLPCAIVKAEGFIPKFIDYKHFNALKWCNGNIDITLPLISDYEREK